MNLEKDVYNQGCKERQTQLGRKGDVIRSGFVPLVETQKKKCYHRIRDPPWGFGGSCHILGIPVLGTNTGKMSPNSWFENQWAIPESCKEQTPLLKSTHRLAYS